MESNELFKMALQLQGNWKVVRNEFSGQPRRLEVWLDFARGSKFTDPRSGELCPVHDTVEKSWRHLNFWHYETILHARVPRIRTAAGEVRLIEVPWAREGSGFTLMFEAVAMLLCQQMPLVAAAELLAEEDTRLWRMVAHYVDKAQRERSWAGVRRILIDETSARKGHRYVSNVLEADTRALLLMVEGRESEALAAVAKELIAHGGVPEQIELIGMDMSPAYIKGAKRHFPKAQIVFDRYHVMVMAGRALDEVRKQLRAQGADLSEGLWALRGNEWARSEEQLKRRRELCAQYPKLGRAMMLREALQDILEEEDPQSLRWWCWRAAVSRLGPFCKLAASIREHWDGIVAFMETRVTNGAIEAVNGLIQLAKRMARGFRSFRYFQLMAYLKAGKLTLHLPTLSPT
ncbi:MAG: ISL3 family transposase [Verrucomicrobiota bacterium]|nr:ISL3 family transposase [Verrucomicrobiota bacterium]